MPGDGGVLLVGPQVVDVLDREQAHRARLADRDPLERIKDWKEDHPPYTEALLRETMPGVDRKPRVYSSVSSDSGKSNTPEYSR